MSKSIIIEEGGISRQLTADKLRSITGGGTCDWIPEDTAVLGTKSISDNGTYKAADDGYYGYSQVTVSGVGTATGKGPDGNIHSVTTDPQTGDLIDTLLPSSIMITTYPAPLTYNDGDTIDYSAMVVKGYLADGTLWTDTAHPNGIIPLSELTLPVTTAQYEPAQGDQ